ncbi:HipA domain-containing protein [Pseudomonas sp. R5(2019)]|uniref:HipA domain-containing protein n=1 Tax=Pseudomonas sp. R5(2019) TaxID=2697566 RepID=UPI00141270BC|nr:HipA domain-containing protein [Pseudomonas sp. R5(2019)]NBA93665.1 type II toxin-antitoxin system HipA family toxin [Pseudomonas sp. R5(2019)]
MRSLHVTINRLWVGTLSEESNAWQFRYAPQWLENPDAFDLSPSLPCATGVIADGSSTRPVQWFFDNLLPEEDARALLAQDAKVEVADAFGLLTWFGAESAGALTLLPEGVENPEGGALPLPDDRLSARIRNLPRVSLSAEAPKRMSLAGAQHKLAVLVQDRELFEPEGSRASSHILKPDHPNVDAYPHSVANEWFVMRLAAALGLPVAEVEIRHIPEPIYLVKRFDRQWRDGELQRLHVLDGCQLLGLDRTFKYQQATFANLRKIIELCRLKAQTRQALFRWLVFNILVGNNDAHLKNLSFHVRPNGIELTPHYDLLSTVVYAPNNDWLSMDLAWPLEGVARTHGDITREVVLMMGEHIQVPRKLGTVLLNQLMKRVEAAGEQMYSSSINELTAGEARQLRLIRFGILKDMLARLA